MSHPLDEAAATKRVIDLMAIPGKSGEEAQAADYIKRALREAGVPARTIAHDNAHTRSPRGGSIGSLIVKLPGTTGMTRAPRRMLSAHIDTVPLCVGSKPKRSGDWVRSADPTTALGADNRSGAAAILTAAVEITQQNLPHPPLTFFWPVQEEVGLIGARLASPQKLGTPKLGFNFDGGNPLKLTLGATGAYRVTITIAGKASHAGVAPQRGVSAINIASKAIADLWDNGWLGLVAKGRKSGTANIGVFEAGDATNVITDKAVLRAEVRSHDPQFREKMLGEVRKAFERAAKAVKNDAGDTGSVTFNADLEYEAFRLNEDSEVVTIARQAVEQTQTARSKGDVVTAVTNGGIDPNWLNRHGIPTVSLGAGQQDPHTVNEALHIPSFLHACRIAATLAQG